MGVTTLVQDWCRVTKPYMQQLGVFNVRSPTTTYNNNTFIPPRIYKGSCIANFSEKKKSKKKKINK